MVTEAFRVETIDLDLPPLSSPQHRELHPVARRAAQDLLAEITEHYPVGLLHHSEREEFITALGRIKELAREHGDG